MTTDLKDVLIDLDSKITEVYDLELAEEMSDIFIDLVDRVDELSTKYWKLVKALATVEKERDDLLSKYNDTLSKYNATLKKNNVTFKNVARALNNIKEERDQAEYDRDYYRNELTTVENERDEYYEKFKEEKNRSESLMKSLNTCIDTAKKMLCEK